MTSRGTRLVSPSMAGAAELTKTAMVAMALFSLGTLLCAWVIRFILRRQNRRLAETGAPTTYPY